MIAKSQFSRGKKLTFWTSASTIHLQTHKAIALCVIKINRWPVLFHQIYFLSALKCRTKQFPGPFTVYWPINVIWYHLLIKKPPTTKQLSKYHTKGIVALSDLFETDSVTGLVCFPKSKQMFANVLTWLNTKDNQPFFMKNYRSQTIMLKSWNQSIWTILGSTIPLKANIKMAVNDLPNLLVVNEFRHF